MTVTSTQTGTPTVALAGVFNIRLVATGAAATFNVAVAVNGGVELSVAVRFAIASTVANVT